GIFLSLAALNWLLEICKWRTLASVVQPVSFREAVRQSLASLTVSLATPGRIGEYGAKAVFFPSNLRKKVLLLTLFSNAAQMAVTCLLGIVGLAYTATIFDWKLSQWHLLLVVLSLVFFGIICVRYRKRSLWIRGLSLSNIFGFLRQLPQTVKWNTMAFAFGRYLVFGLLFYALLQFFGAGIPLLEAVPIILSMYLLVSVLPTLFLFDVVVRGGVAVWLFGLAGVPEWPVLYAVFSMWLLNFVLPALWGSYYVILYRRK
ncbi:MAG: lysylphosphatidylglycerol synthase domain-containing protein, partial [Bacteroidota bacterium]